MIHKIFSKSRIKNFLGLTFLCSIFLSACYPHHPQSTFNAQGPVGVQQEELFVLMFWLAIAVFAIVQSILIYVLINFKRREYPIPGTDIRVPDVPPKQVHGNTKLEIVWTVIPVLLLIAIAVPTVQTIYSTAKPPVSENVYEQPLEIEVIGHQWWFEFRYTDEGVVTANELYIPTGRPVSIQLRSQDVIHSFWIPKLAGKVDLVPNNENSMWIQADVPGDYSGQCAEFCGIAHGRMRFRVHAETPENFDKWLEDMRTPPAPYAGEGYGLFLANCSMCHSIDSYTSGSYEREIQVQDERWNAWYSDPEGAVRVSAPNLTHLAMRTTLASGEQPLNRENLIKWIEDPSIFKIGTRMQEVAQLYEGKNAKLAKNEIESIADYLLSLSPPQRENVSGETGPTEVVSKEWDSPEEHGEYLYTSYGCSSCHSIDEEQTKIIGPAMWDIYERSATQIEGLSPEEYIEQSIRYPNEYIVEDYPEGVMPLIFENLPAEEIESLIAYLKTLSKN